MNGKSIAAVLAAFGSVAVGASFAADGETNLSEVTVSDTAATIEEAREKSTLGGLSMDKPVSGTVLGRDDLEIVRSVSSLQDLLTRVPGVSKSRNLRISDGGKNYTENRVDGMRVRNTGTFGFVDQNNTADIERIEFITGPGTVLQSSYTIGGTINVVTRDPPQKPTLQFSQEAGEYGFSRSDVSGGATMANGFGYLFDANIMRNKAWRARATEDKDAFSAKLAGKPSESSKLYLRLEYLYDDALYPGNLTTAQWDADWQQAQPGVYGRGMTRYVTPSLQFKQAVGEKGELTVGLSQRITDATTYGNTSTYTSFSNRIGVSKATETGTQVIYRQDFDFAKSRLYVGLENMRSENDSKQYANVYTNAQALLGNFAPGALDMSSGNSLTNENHLSPLVNYEFSPLDKLRFHMGVRSDHITYKVDDRTTKNKDGEATFKRDVPKLGATYELDANNLIWVSYAEGFLAPAVSTMLASGTPGNTTNAGGNGYIPAANLLPEESKTHEIGFRGFLPDSRLRYDVTVYHTDNKNMVLQRDCTAAEKASIGCYRLNENVGSMTAKGIETGLSLAATRWLDVAVSHTLAFTTYGTYKSATFDYSGNSYYFSPKHHLNLRLAFKPAPGWVSELEGDYTSSYYLDQANSDQYKRPNLYHLRTAYSDSGNRWSAWLQILNLFDIKYAERMAMSGGARVYNDGYLPRTLRAGVSFKW